jgi:hypothetical protein
MRDNGRSFRVVPGPGNVDPEDLLAPAAYLIAAPNLASTTFSSPRAHLSILVSAPLRPPASRWCFRKPAASRRSAGKANLCVTLAIQSRLLMVDLLRCVANVDLEAYCAILSRLRRIMLKCLDHTSVKSVLED